MLGCDNYFRNLSNDKQTLKMINISPIKSSNLTDIVYIHRNAYDDGHFTNLMPDDLLKKYYDELSKNSKINTSFILYKDEQPAGFIICGQGLNEIVKLFVKNHIAELVFIVIKNPSFLITKFKAVFSRFSKKPTWKSNANVRLLSIAVAKPFQGRGTGQELISILEDKIKSNGINIYGLSVKKNNKKAIKFYLASEFTLEHSDEKSEYYIKEIK